MMTALRASCLLRATAAPRIVARVVAEPYRVFFPLATFAGLVGVAMWPLHLGGWLASYPGIVHARLMVHGFFLGFIAGFLGTAFPRLLGVRPLGRGWLAAWLGAYLLMLVALMSGHVLAGDLTFLSLVGLMVAFALTRLRVRTDLPPPGFVLVALGLGCGIAGGLLGVADGLVGIDPFWVVLQKLLSHQGMVLLPVLGVGGFLLPRFFGLPTRQDFPESREVSRAWLGSAAVASAVGGLLLATFVGEALGYVRAACVVRGLIASVFFLREVPWHRASLPGTAVSRVLKAGCAAVLVGLLSVALWPAWRVALLHITLAGGLAVIVFVVATRVIFGHSGNVKSLQLPNRWLWVAWGMMILGLISRIVGDFLPRIMGTHYNYGAFIWIAGALLWAVCVLPKVAAFEDET